MTDRDKYYQAMADANEPTRTWECEKCGHTVERYRGQNDVFCANCGTPYNCFGQRLRDDYRSNPSNYDDNISDLEGYERAALRKDAEWW